MTARPGRPTDGLERHGLDGFEAIAAEWEELAVGCGDPFSTSSWLGNWWRACAPGDVVALVLRDEAGEMLAGGCFLDRGRGGLEAAANAHSNDWRIVARDRGAAGEFWARIAAIGVRRLVLGPLSGADELAASREELGGAGYRLFEEELEPSPTLELPESLEALLATRSRNLRSQVGRRRRGLESEGELTFRQLRGGEGLDRDLDDFFALEAAGWKGKGGTGTAIATDPALVDLYRGFAGSMAASGRLRLYMLELDGKLIAADYGCVLASCGYLVKTAFDEDLGRLAPGLVLRAEALRASIEEGLDRYDFLGGPDSYKMRWTDEVRPRCTLRAFRGLGSAPAYAWRASLRPALKSAREGLRGRTRVAR